MATFGTPPTVINLDDPSPGGSTAAAPKAKGPTKITDTTFPQNDPWGQFYQKEVANTKAEKMNKLAKQQAIENEANAKEAASGPGVKDIAKGFFPALGSIITNNPLDTAYNVSYGMGKGLLHLGDVPAAVVNGIAHVAGVKGRLQYPGQTLIDWIDSQHKDESDVAKALQSGSSTAFDYELGGGIVKGVAPGLGATASRIAGNVAGGQLNAPFGASASERAKAAAFDAAFGGADSLVRKGAAAVKASRAATQVVTEAKGNVMNGAISAFEKADSPNYNPEVAGQLRKFLELKAFDKPKTMVDFETNLQKHLGDSFYDPKVNDVLQPIIDEGHARMGAAAGPRIDDSGPIKPQDVFDTETFHAKAEANAQAKPAEVKYEAKESLGRDTAGNKKLATTVVDTKTGNAIVYYDKSLDAHPEMKQTVLDHEEGHILDKRLNGGNNLSSELPNYNGNKANLEKTLGDFARAQGKDVQEVSAALQRDIEALSGGKSDHNENFADAVAMYRTSPKEAHTMAPTFSRLMEYVPNEGRFAERSTTLEGLKQDSPLAGKLVEDKMAEVKATAKEKADARVKLDATSKPSKTAGGKVGSTGLDTGERVKGKPSFNPDKINAPEDVEKLFNKMDAENANFSKQRMAKDNEQIRDLARLTGLTEEELIKARPGSIANAETLTAARQLVINKAFALAEKIKSIDTATATSAQLAELRDDFIHLVSMQKSVAGLRTEAANALRSLQLEVSPEENFTLRELLGNLKKMNIASDGDAALFAGKVAKQFQMSTTDRIGRGALQTWYAAILSGPKTTVRNVLSTGANILTELAAKAGNPKQWKEIAPAVKGLIQGLKEGSKDFKAILSGEKGSTSKFIEADSVRPPTFTGKFAGYGHIAESVGRFLNAQDALMKSGARAMEEASLKVSSPEMSEAVQKSVADWYGEFSVYHGNPRGQVARALSEGVTKITTGAPVLKTIVPFVKTIANVLDRQFDYMPITSMLRMRPAFIAREVDQLMNHFDLTSPADRAAITQRLFDQQVGRMALGTAITGAAVVAAKSGLVSGVGPTNYSQRIELQRTGWRPNSVKIGDAWVPYTYLGPLGGLLSVAGNIYDKVTYDKAPNGDVEKLIGKGLVGWGQTQLNQSFLNGVANFMDVLGGNKTPEDYMKDLGAGLVPIPALFTQTKDIAKNAYSHISGDVTAKQQYETHNIVEKLRTKLGLEGGLFGMDPLHPKLDMFGEPMTADLIFGVTPSITKADTVDNYLVANDILVTIPPKGQTYTDPTTGQPTTLTPAQYEEYMKKSGAEIYRNLEEMIPGLKQEDIDTQRKEVRAMLDQVRSDAREQILSK